MSHFYTMAEKINTVLTCALAALFTNIRSRKTNKQSGRAVMDYMARVKLLLMIKAVLWSRLAMMHDNIRNTHTHVLWEKGFGVKHSWS